MFVTNYIVAVSRDEDVFSATVCEIKNLLRSSTSRHDFWTHLEAVLNPQGIYLKQLLNLSNSSRKYKWKANYEKSE